MRSEIKKYPGEQALYEQMLQWLGQTNLVDEQLRVYQEALRAFPSTTWRDRWRAGMCGTSERKNSRRFRAT
jgi:hypothetical protein